MAYTVLYMKSKYLLKLKNTWFPSFKTIIHYQQEFILEK